MTTYIYGLAGADQNYRPTLYEALREDVHVGNMTKTLLWKAKVMQMKCPNIESVYVIDNRRELKDDFAKAAFGGSIEDCVCFKTILEEYGIKII